MKSRRSLTIPFHVGMVSNGEASILDVETYRKKKLELAERQPHGRQMCLRCRQPSFGCYCEAITRIDLGMRFVILIHPIEVKRRIATGRMSHLCLERSELIEGKEYSANTRVNEILADPNVQPFILYPGPTAANLSKLTGEEKRSLFDPSKEPVIFVIDGTWATARKMMRSANLMAIPKICFSPERPSTFRVRKQPAPGCVSTIEAIHQTIEHFDGINGITVRDRRHDKLLNVFDVMVERQLGYITELKNTRQMKFRKPKKIFADL